MKEYAVGETFKYEGTELKVLRIINTEKCEGCFFDNFNCDNVPCISVEREDMKNVLYKEVKEVKEIKNEDALFWVNSNDVVITLKEGYTEEALRVLRGIHPNAKFKNHLGDEIQCTK